MLAKALNLCAQPMKWDETSFNTPFGTKMCKKPIFHDFPIQMYGAIEQKHVTYYPGMLLISNFSVKLLVVYFGPRVYQTGSLVIALIHGLLVCLYYLTQLISFF